MKIAITKLKLNPVNPRIIKDYRFKKLVKSIKDFPEMLNLREIVVNKDMVVLGGNMRLRACIEAGLKEVPYKIADIPPEKEREFIIKDNVSFGENDWEILANDWNTEELAEWGLEVWQNNDDKIKSEWEGMPEFDQEDQSAFKVIKVRFDNEDDYLKFANMIDQNLTESTKSIWFPQKDQNQHNRGKVYTTNES